MNSFHRAKENEQVSKADDSSFHQFTEDMKIQQRLTIFKLECTFAFIDDLNDSERENKSSTSIYQSFV